MIGPTAAAATREAINYLKAAPQNGICRSLSISLETRVANYVFFSAILGISFASLGQIAAQVHVNYKHINQAAAASYALSLRFIHKYISNSNLNKQTQRRHCRCLY